MRSFRSAAGGCARRPGYPRTPESSSSCLADIGLILPRSRSASSADYDASRALFRPHAYSLASAWTTVSAAHDLTGNPLGKRPVGILKGRLSPSAAARARGPAHTVLRGVIGGITRPHLGPRRPRPPPTAASFPPRRPSTRPCARSPRRPRTRYGTPRPCSARNSRRRMTPGRSALPAGVPGHVNDASQAEFASAAATNVFGPDRLTPMPYPEAGAEDFPRYWSGSGTRQSR